jgi:hypothetical protein
LVNNTSCKTKDVPPTVRYIAGSWKLLYSSGSWGNTCTHFPAKKPVNRQASPFLPATGRRNSMHVPFMIYIKSLVKTSLDNYVLPGTVSGTEILWLYMIHWKRDFAALTFASFYLLLPQLDLFKTAKTLCQVVDHLDIGKNRRW